MEIDLDALPVPKEASVIRINVPEGLERRLRDFGLIPGTSVRCLYRSPQGDVTALGLRGTVIALRTRDLKGIRCQW